MTRIAMALLLLSLTACQFELLENDDEAGHVGDSCGDSEFWNAGPCRADLVCVAGTCQRQRPAVGLGATCDGFTPCKPDLHCAGRCVPFRALGETCSSPTDQCDRGLLCHWSKECHQAAPICVRQELLGRVVTCDAGADASSD